MSAASIRRILGFAGKAGLYILALIGLIWLVGGPVTRLITGPLYVTDIVLSLPSPDRGATAQVQVRSGGLRTVSTTRVHLRFGQEADEYWTVYEAKDSDYVPALRWADRETLVITLPCERFDYVSNPDDWKREDPAERRLKVRFTYAAECRLPSG